ncbi:MAG: AMP-binding protein, partial [candidate division WOR-3 bacterium]|nr:AMP-binding protein [candidate division WOR-3 bacterium]MDW7987964.1 AMP-binding protein [candidate division WOR-3 bacterium]
MELIRKTIGEILEENAQKYPNNEAVVYVDDNLRYTWSELLSLVDKTAKALLACGIKRHDHVAIWGTNKLEWLLTQLATARIGAGLVTVNPEWKSSEVEYALKQSDTKALVMIEGFEKKSGDKIHQYNYIEILKEACPELEEAFGTDLKLSRFPELKKIILINRTPLIPKWALAWSDFIKLADNISEEVFQAAIKETSPDDVCLIQYTSGTTGFPKGAMLTHYNVVNNARAGAYNLELTPLDRVCIPVPYYHCFGTVLGNLLCITTGATMVVPAEHFNARKTLIAVEKEKCTVIHGVPSMFISELNDPEFSKFNLSTLRTGIMAGAPCPIELMKDVVYKMGAKKMTIVYGLTEASPITHQTRPNDSIERRVSTVGKPIEHVEAKIVDPITEKELGVGEVGEIWVRGYNVMKGYYKKPEETAKAITKDGWLRTGDLGVKDEEGYYKIVGRYKDMVIVGGHNVYPAEVEEALRTIFADEIMDVHCVGVPHKVLQEVVAAVIKLKPNKTLTLEEIRARCE